MDLNDTSLLVELFESHGISVSVENDWVLPDGGLPAIGFSWNGTFTEHAGHLDVSVVLATEKVLVESFAGMGDTSEQRQKDALESFLQSSFHVLLSAYWNHVDEEQVVIEHWQIADEKWTAYIGNYINRGSTGTETAIPEEAFEKLQSAVTNTELREDSHWLRTYFCNIDGELIFEALNNNQPWKEGDKCIRDTPWAVSKGFYSVRHFMVLRHMPNAA